MNYVYLVTKANFACQCCLHVLEMIMRLKLDFILINQLNTIFNGRTRILLSYIVCNYKKYITVINHSDILFMVTVKI